MASSSFNMNNLRIVTVTIGTITLSAEGYLDISSHHPTLQSNERIITVGVANWRGVNPVAGFNITESGQYIFGSANQKITDLQVRYVIGRVPIN